MKILIVILALIIVPYAYADMSCTASLYQQEPWSSGRGDSYQAGKSVKVECTMLADTDPAEILFSSFAGGVILNAIKGGILRQVNTGPGDDAPASAFTLTFDNYVGRDWFSITTTKTAQFEEWDVGTIMGYYPTFWDVGIDFPDIGDTGDDYILYFEILK